MIWAALLGFFVGAMAGFLAALVKREVETEWSDEDDGK